MSQHGTPCWFELSTSDPEAVKSFYGQLFGWQVAPSENVDFDYWLAQRDGTMIAGMVPLAACPYGHAAQLAGLSGRG